MYHNLAAALCLMCCAACAGDPLTGESDIPNPGAARPFAFTAAPPPAITTRAVPGQDQWKGDGTEKIRVRMTGDGIAVPAWGIYTVISPEGKTEVRPGDQPVLWPSADVSYDVYAWYPALEPGVEHDVSDQSTPEKFRQADVLWAGEIVPYHTTPVLEFSHQMAKVRVVLTGVDPSAAGTEVVIKGPTRFTLRTSGEISSTGSDNYITACRDAADSDAVAFEALLPVKSGNALSVPTENFIRILTGGRTYYFTPASGLTLRPGKAYTYRVAIPPSATAARHILLPADAAQHTPAQ